MEIIVTGSNGLIGNYLVSKLLHEGHKVKCLVREKTENTKNNIYWEPENGILVPERLEKADVVIHLAGEKFIAKNPLKVKWNDEKKEKLIKSRIKGTRFLCDTISKLHSPPKLLISASSVFYYGNRGFEKLTENSMPGKGFLSQLSLDWEKSTQLAVRRGIRVVNARIGIVVSPTGGIFKSMLIPFKMGLGGTISDGKQYISWIDIEDLVDAFIFTMNNESISGPVNYVSPNPVTNKIYTKTMGTLLKRPTFMKMPKAIINKALGELGEEILLSSTKAVPEKLLKSGFTFKNPGINNALSNMIK